MRIKITPKTNRPKIKIMGNLSTSERYRVTAVSRTSGATKVVAKRVGAFRATKLWTALKLLDFDVKVERVGN